jgi:hypothetical protein
MFGLGEKERKTRSDKRIRVNASLDDETHEKLRKLAFACGQTKTMMAAIILRDALNTPEDVTMYQNIYNKNPENRIMLARVNNELKYLISN